MNMIVIDGLVVTLAKALDLVRAQYDAEPGELTLSSERL